MVNQRSKVTLNIWKPWNPYSASPGARGEDVAKNSLGLNAQQYPQNLVPSPIFPVADCGAGGKGIATEPDCGWSSILPNVLCELCGKGTFRQGKNRPHFGRKASVILRADAGARNPATWLQRLGPPAGNPQTSVTSQIRWCTLGKPRWERDRDRAEL